MHDGAALEAHFHVAADLRAFDGHFPGAPVLPGAYLLAIVLQQIEQQPALRERLGAAWQVQQVKFLAPVGPGQTLRIRLEVRGNAIAFGVHHGSTLVARGQLAGAAAAT
ncbi:MAG TPA: MaoC/PaaZ C-terminal domain-containing protein [Burkholderiaceae bacterium]|nr:MaoC/PaaZ C-terminal domain-containing protein [Burkholderiaceae bacterium]